MKATRYFQILAVSLGFHLGGTPFRAIAADEAPPSPTVPIDQLISPTASNSVPLIDFRVLKTLLPEPMPDFRRTQISGEKSGILGIAIAFAEALYRGPAKEQLSLKITDMGGMRSIMLMAQAGWATIEIDRETETGYERTVIIGGFKGHEEYDHVQRRGEIRILLGTRFLVEITGSEIAPTLLRAAAETIDYRRLADLVPNLSPLTPVPPVSPPAGDTPPTSLLRDAATPPLTPSAPATSPFSTNPAPLP